MWESVQHFREGRRTSSFCLPLKVIHNDQNTHKMVGPRWPVNHSISITKRTEDNYIVFIFMLFVIETCRDHSCYSSLLHKLHLQHRRSLNQTLCNTQIAGGLLTGATRTGEVIGMEIAAWAEDSPTHAIAMPRSYPQTISTVIIPQGRAIHSFMWSSDWWQAYQFSLAFYSSLIETHLNKSRASAPVRNWMSMSMVTLAR